jgi:hypothetical protein
MSLVLDKAWYYTFQPSRGHKNKQELVTIPCEVNTKLKNIVGWRQESIATITVVSRKTKNRKRFIELKGKSDPDLHEAPREQQVNVDYARVRQIATELEEERVECKRVAKYKKDKAEWGNHIRRTTRPDPCHPCQPRQAAETRYSPAQQGTVP